MNFCPNCGRKLILQEIAARPRPICDKTAEGCGYIDFGHYSLGVGGLVLDTNANGEPRVLLIQRNEEPNKGGWTIPGGYVEFDETVDQAVVREVEEETGLRCEMQGLVGYRNRADLNDNTSYVVFLLQAVGGALKTEPNLEIAQVGFYTLAEMQQIERLAPLSFELARYAIEKRLHFFQPVSVAGLNGRPPFTLFI
jgi:ADP-ribose pyrophosphatase YjhB (NUDIX family)